MDIWIGQLNLSNGKAVKDVHIYSTHESRPQPIPHGATLTFVSLVELCLVPLHLVIGPSCGVGTENPDTQAWFHDQLIREPKAWSHPEDKSWFEVSSQSHAGILASVKSHEDDLSLSQITDILLFAVVEPSSSGGDWDLSVQVQAVPLACGLESLQISELNQNSLVDNGCSVLQGKSQSQNIFDAATEIRRRSQGRGGIEVAAAAAGLSRARLLVGHKKSKGIQSQTSVAAVPRGETSQISTKTDVLSPIEGIERQQLLTRSSSSSTLQTVSGPSSNSKDFVALEQQNKDAISRLVMAGMRLYGYQPRRRKSAFNEMEETQSFSSDDHKLVYHQTYKAAIFIFRNHMQSSGLHLQTEAISETVDHLLTLFSTDPLATRVSAALGFP